jgi:hypothetical protein
MPVICSLLGTVTIAVAPLSAHQQQNTTDLEIMIHLDPDDSPYAKKPSFTWFMLMRKNGDMVSPATCNCRAVIYNSQNQVIDRSLSLSTMSIPGHKKDHQGFRTMITFPKPGKYKVVFTGQAKDKSFKPFNMAFPVTVRPELDQFQN